MLEVDVLIVGAGPAGATAALNLAPLHRVLVVERRATTAPRIGESLPPAARRLLADMDLLASFLGEGHAPCHAKRACWGSPQPVETDLLRDPDGHGWQLDRGRFDAWLRAMAVARGAAVLVPARLEGVERSGRRWRAKISTDDGSGTVTASVLIDAAGRAAPVARRLGVRRRTDDRLVCGWVRGRDRDHRPGAGITYVESAEEGWWYTAPLPGAQRILAFHTDADLPAARIAAHPAHLANRADTITGLGKLLREVRFEPEELSGFTAAHSSTLTRPAGAGWLAVGDAALTFDPLSSQGLFNALFTGLAAAETAHRVLADDPGAAPEYTSVIDGIAAAYRAQLASLYSAELRWPGAPFWHRRRQVPQIDRDKQAGLHDPSPRAPTPARYT